MIESPQVKTLLLIDDRLGPNQSVNRVHQIVSLLQESLIGKCKVLGFDPDQALTYLKDKDNSVDLLVCDHNLWWRQRENKTYEYRYGYQLMMKFREYRGNLPPTIIFSDDELAEGMWRDAGVEYETFVPKWGDEFKNLLAAVNLKLLS